uniref:Uncharacterized protein n=1 Tax=Nelumbo nucifera TaxID=4432 RepID=A0A822ZN07_NELNU|nr:TPA_asm: hypothetical protein HUJ06_003105 [Nelumbo nucifera]
MVPETRRLLGHLSLEGLYSTMVDLVTLCNSGGSHWFVRSLTHIFLFTR